MGFDYRLHVFHSPQFQSVVDEAIEFFNNTPVHRLPPPDTFAGTGVYGYTTLVIMSCMPGFPVSTEGTTHSRFMWERLCRLDGGRRGRR
jgi:hypothetical protein